jgi:predicted protein tyrosine phosphatase
VSPRLRADLHLRVSTSLPTWTGASTSFFRHHVIVVGLMFFMGFNLSRERQINRMVRIKAFSSAYHLRMGTAVSPVSTLRYRDMAVSDEQQDSDAHLREIADLIRQLARQSHIAEAQEELFDLADRLDRMADLARQIPRRRPGRGARRKT